MKTVLKRLLSFVLVAMMLVSVLPFQASADTMVTVYVQIEGEADPLETSGVAAFENEVVTREAVLEAIPTEYEDYNVLYITHKWGVGDDKGWSNDPESIGVNEFYKTDENSDPVYAVYVMVEAPAEKDWTIQIKGDMSKDIEVSETVNDAYLNALMPNHIDDDVYTWVITSIDDDEKVAVVTATYIEYDLTVTVEQYDEDDNLIDSEVFEDTFHYNDTYTINAKSILNYDENLYEADANDGKTVTITGDADYVVKLTPSGYKRAKLLSKGTDGSWVDEGYVYWMRGARLKGWKEAPIRGTTTGFTHWESENGHVLTSGTVGTNETLDDVYYAQYKTEYNNGHSNVRIHASYFVDGILHHTERNIIEPLEMPTGDKVFGDAYLGATGVKQEIRLAVDAITNKDTFKEAEWDGGFYTDEDCEKEASSTLKATGTTNLYVRVDADKSEIASVHLYVHKKVGSSYVDIIKMKGYLAGDEVSLDDAIDAVKKNDWRASAYKLYSDTDWEHMLAGATNVGDVPSVTVEADGSVDIHILLKDGYKTSGTASDNPKTGDSVMIAITTLGLSASALIVLYFLNKKKQVM